MQSENTRLLTCKVRTTIGSRLRNNAGRENTGVILTSNDDNEEIDNIKELIELVRDKSFFKIRDLTLGI